MTPTPETHLALHRHEVLTRQRENERRRALREARRTALSGDPTPAPRRWAPLLRLRRVG